MDISLDEYVGEGSPRELTERRNWLNALFFTSCDYITSKRGWPSSPHDTGERLKLSPVGKLLFPKHKFCSAQMHES